ncbi:response regulator transcription factor [Brevibacillus agri]|uniref:winged helix-turn-helix domain-containing protein n=1 Tax=Brevibacillus agri TaxID=51101 RepID=UPI003D25544F
MQGFSKNSCKNLALGQIINPDFPQFSLIISRFLAFMHCSASPNWLRAELKADIPIIMLTAKVDERDRIKGLEMGADDYLTKPFSPKELVVRVETVLRRTAQRCSKITYRGITVKPQRGEINYYGEPISLTQHEFKLLYYLMKHPNQVLTREQIINELYPNLEKIVISRTIDVHIGRLREKLKWDGDADLIETVRGMGYRFVAYQKK